jgi:N-acetylmuramoyl-L-alanine amidase
MTNSRFPFMSLRCLPLLAALMLPGCALFEEGSGLSDFRTVVVDPGHGGYDNGAKACRGLPEKMLTLDVARRLKPLLQARGYRVVMTRDTDVFIPLKGRTDVSNARPDSIFVSIHCNDSPRHAADGVEAYYYAPRSSKLAGAILRQIAPCYGSHSRGVKFAHYYVLHHNTRPATLLELGFLSNPKENSRLQDPKVRQVIAERIASGIAGLEGGHAPTP